MRPLLIACLLTLTAATARAETVVCSEWRGVEPVGALMHLHATAELPVDPAAALLYVEMTPFPVVVVQVRNGDALVMTFSGAAVGMLPHIDLEPDAPGDPWTLAGWPYAEWVVPEGPTPPMQARACFALAVAW